MALFLYGSVIANTSLFHETEKGTSNRISAKIAVGCVLVFGLHLASFPELGGSKTPGFTWLAAIVFNSRYWQSIGAVIIVACVAKLSILRRIFSSSLLQYLGRISFALYLVHLPLLSTLGWRLVPTVWEVVGRAHVLNKFGGLLITFVLTLPLVVWAADLFYRFFDRPCISFSREFEAYLRVANA